MQTETIKQGHLSKRFAFTTMQLAQQGAGDPAPLLGPGETRWFLARPQLVYRLREVTLLGAEKGKAASADHPLIFSEVRAADPRAPGLETHRIIPVGKGGSKIEMPEPVTYGVAESILCAVHNPSKKSWRASLTCSGDAAETMDNVHSQLPLGALACELGVPQTHFVVQPSRKRGVGKQSFEMMSPYCCRPRRLWIRSDSQLDLLVEDIKVGNRSQLVSADPLPVESFDGIGLSLDTVAIAQSFSLHFINRSKKPRWVEIEVEADVVTFDATAN
jgi:hypothetical protein